MEALVREMAVRERETAVVAEEKGRVETAKVTGAVEQAGGKEAAVGSRAEQRSPVDTCRLTSRSTVHTCTALCLAWTAGSNLRRRLVRTQR